MTKEEKIWNIYVKSLNLLDDPDLNIREGVIIKCIIDDLEHLIPPRECKYCADEFFPTHASQIYCTEVCKRREAKRLLRTRR